MKRSAVTRCAALRAELAAQAWLQVNSLASAGAVTLLFQAAKSRLISSDAQKKTPAEAGVCAAIIASALTIDEVDDQNVTLQLLM